MTISLETEIVATRHDPATRTSFYTIERDGRRWTVSIHEDEFTRLPKGNRQARRDYLGKALANAMSGPHEKGRA